MKRIVTVSFKGLYLLKGYHYDYTFYDHGYILIKMITLGDAKKCFLLHVENGLSLCICALTTLFISLNYYFIPGSLSCHVLNFITLWLYNKNTSLRLYIDLDN